MKKIGFLFTMIILSGCASSNLENEKVVRLMFENFNKHQWKEMAACYDTAALFLDPSLGIEYVNQTHEQIVNKYGEMEKMFPDLHDEIVSLETSGDNVIVQFIASGSSGDSIQFKLPIAAILTVKSGKIVKDATYYDQQ